MLIVIIPANNEERFIEACLASVYAQTVASDAAGGKRLIVAANACTDRTIALAEATAPRAAASGWALTVLDLPAGGKPGALNAADAAAGPVEPGDARIYLDADVIAEPPLFADLLTALETEQPRYASGRLNIAPAQSPITRAYARFWRRLPFMTRGVPGAGLFAVNAAGRARWGDFPDIISDDTFVRLTFAPDERIGVSSGYLWPLAEGFGRLRRVRRRQNEGVEEISRLYPALIANNDSKSLGASGLLSLIASAPVGFAIYAAVSAAVKFDMMRNRSAEWTRGR